MINLPPSLNIKEDGTVEVFVRTDIDTLNKFLPSTKAIKHCNNKGISWEYQADIWEKYKRKWARALTIFPKVERKERLVDTIIVSRRTRLIDVENLYGGSKPIRDTLQRRGWLYDDAPRWGSLELTQEKVKKADSGTLIILRKKND